MNPITTYPMAQATVPTPTPQGPRWRPAPYTAGASPFMGRIQKRRMGQIFGSQSLFDHPLIGLAVDAGAISISALALAKKSRGGERAFEGVWRTVAWAVLVASGIKAVNDLVRLMTMPGPVPSTSKP